MRQIRLIADDFGIAAGVDRAILDLLDRQRLSGTSCMTVFAEWPRQARLLGGRPGAVGLHVTLTDQTALTGRSALAPEGKLPALTTLLGLAALRRLPDADVLRELDAQHDAFVAATGAPPAHVDGHQHVHFLPPVRRWLLARAAGGPRPMPWLRGAPSSAGAGLKTRIVARMAAGFDTAMRAGGYEVRGPLHGFYDWSRQKDFAGPFGRMLGRLTDGAVLMCHPGMPDDTLRRRDRLVEQRLMEHEFLGSSRFVDVLAQHDVVLVSP